MPAPAARLTTGRRMMAAAVRAQNPPPDTAADEPGCAAGDPTASAV